MRTILLSACLLALSGPLLTAQAQVPAGVAVDPDAGARLIVSRDRNAPNACDLQLSIDNQVIAPLPLGESVTLDVPSGERQVILAPSKEGLCANIPLVSSQSLLLQPGETRRYQAIYEANRLFLAPQQ